MVATVLIVGLGGLAMGQVPRKSRLNPIIELLEQKKPVFGLYAPSNRRGGPPQPGTVAPAVQLPEKSPAELAKEALGYGNSDFVFDGSMEGNFERGYSTYAEFVKGIAQLGLFVKTPT